MGQISSWRLSGLILVRWLVERERAGGGSRIDHPPTFLPSAYSRKFKCSASSLRLLSRHQYSCVFSQKGGGRGGEGGGIFGSLTGEKRFPVFPTLYFEFVVAQNMQKLRKLDSYIGSMEGGGERAGGPLTIPLHHLTQYAFFLSF